MITRLSWGHGFHGYSHMNRREAIGSLLALATAAANLAAAAQGSMAKKIPVLGVLSALPIASPERWESSPFWVPLRKLGWVEGRNLKVERASAEGDVERLPAMAQTLVSKGVDAIFAPGNESAIAAARATTTIPIVFWGVNYPIEIGLAKSLARPGGNVTGISLFVGPDESAKTLDYLRELLPRARKLSYIHEAAQIRKMDGTEWPLAHGYIETAASARGFELQEYPITTARELGPAFDRIARLGTQALYVGYSQLMLRESDQIIDFANRSRLPSVFNSQAQVQRGGILSYGADVDVLFERAANLVDKALRGANPSNLPIELPTKYDLWVNAKAAKAIGLEIPKSILVRADEVLT
jgi:putative tryptophan/tyrosine transport system substrate-binding protein